MLIVSEWKKRSPLVFVSASHLNIRVCSLCHFLPMHPFKMLPFVPLRKLRTCENVLNHASHWQDQTLTICWDVHLNGRKIWRLWVVGWALEQTAAETASPDRNLISIPLTADELDARTLLFFSPLPTLIPALLLVPGEVDNKPNSLEIVNRATQGWSPWAACGGDHVLDKHLQLPHFLHALLLEQISSALGCEINIMVEVWNEASSTCRSLEESASE